MSADHDTLADLHRRYDGPIPDCLRDQALAGRAAVMAPPSQPLSRDIDRLALAAVRSLGRWRIAPDSDAAKRRFADEAVKRLSRALRSYRDAGVALRDQR